jgi:hypothetical protein
MDVATWIARFICDRDSLIPDNMPPNPETDEAGV